MLFLPTYLQAGAEDSFTLRCKDVGAPYRLWGNINYRNSCNSWALSRVEVTNEKTGGVGWRQGRGKEAWNSEARNISVNLASMNKHRRCG